MLSRAAKILEAVRRELERHEKALETDASLRRVQFDIKIGERSGDPVKILYTSFSENDLTAAKKTA